MQGGGRRVRSKDMKLRIRQFSKFWIVPFFIVSLGVAASAQTFRGTILGTVTDPSGAVVAGAKVIVHNTETGLDRTTQTAGDGSYTVPELPVGKYAVTVSLAGFESAVTTDVVVDVATERRVDVALRPGQVSQRVEVSGEQLPQVDTTSDELGGTMTSQTVENLPINGRDYTKLIFLNPGVAGSPDQITDSPGSYGEFSMNGSRGRSNNFLLDGTDMNDGYRNNPSINEAGVFGDPATILPLDAVAELRVLSNYEAEYGRNGGAVINIVTKSGTNKLHGSLLEFFRSGKLGARNYFNQDVDPKNPFNNNQFGGALGGPIVKDKTFFFADYEGQRENGAQSGTSCVPDPAMIAAAESAITARGEVVDPVITALLARHPYPTPNISGATSDESGCNTPNLSVATPFTNRVDSMIAKIDHSFNPSNMLSGRYYFGDSSQSFPFAQLAAGLLPGFNTFTPTRVQLVSISWVKVMNSNQVNEARLGWNRFAEGFFPQDQNFNPDSIGLDTGVGPRDYGLPSIAVGSFSQIGATSSLPRYRVDANWHFLDNYSWKFGKHAVKFGYEFRRTTIKQVLDQNFRGKLSFDAITDPSNPAVTLQPLEAFLEGLPDGDAQITGNTLRHTFENSHGLYIQDSFRFTPRLTFNYGMRWDYFGVVSEGNNLMYRFSPANGGTLTQVSGSNPLYDPDRNNFAPRVAFAYDLTGHGKTVVRGGWGMFYDAFSQDVFLGHAPWNCVFCPGPAYVGAAAGVSFGASNSGPLAANQPVFGGFGPNPDDFVADPHLRTPYIQNFNLNVQQQVGTRTVLQVAYVGSKGTKLFQFLDVNQPSQQQITAYDLSTDSVGYLSVPRVFANFPEYLNEEKSSANSIYNALQTSLRVNSWHGLSTQANFVWSHSIDTASDLEDFTPNQAQPQDSTNPAGNRGDSSFDIRRRFSWNFTYEFPHWGGSMARLRNGWGVDGTVNLQDGQPWQLNYYFWGDYSGSGEGFDRPDVVGPVEYSGNPSQYLNLSSFAAPCVWGNPDNDGTSDESNCVPGSRHFGDEGRNSLRAPSFKEFNFSVFKNTAISERLKLQLRAEFFNLFNHPNFADPEMPAFFADAGPPDPATGRNTGFYPITATGDVAIGNPFLGGGGPRGVQFSAKITF